MGGRKKGGVGDGSWVVYSEFSLEYSKYYARCLHNHGSTPFSNEAPLESSPNLHQ